MTNKSLLFVQYSQNKSLKYGALFIYIVLHTNRLTCTHLTIKFEHHKSFVNQNESFQKRPFFAKYPDFDERFINVDCLLLRALFLKTEAIYFGLSIGLANRKQAGKNQSHISFTVVSSLIKTARLR